MLTLQFSWELSWDALLSLLVCLSINVLDEGSFKVWDRGLPLSHCCLLAQVPSTPGCLWGLDYVIWDTLTTEPSWCCRTQLQTAPNIWKKVFPRVFISLRLWERGRNSHISQKCCSSLTKSQTWRLFHAKWVTTETVWSPLGRPPCHVKKKNKKKNPLFQAQSSLLRNSYSISLLFILFSFFLWIFCFHMLNIMHIIF